MNKYLEYNDNKTIIKKDDGIGGIYYTETDKIDFGFKYDNLAYNEEKEDFAYCVKNNWLILDKDKIKTISDYIDNFEIKSASLLILFHIFITYLINIGPIVL